jgi:hypothetical protein
MKQDSWWAQFESSLQMIILHDFWHGLREGVSCALLDSLAVWRVGFRSDGAGVRFSQVKNREIAGNPRLEIEILKLEANLFW